MVSAYHFLDFFILRLVEKRNQHHKQNHSSDIQSVLNIVAL